jgi:hypothetical protein
MPRRGLLARRFTARKRKHTNGKNKPTWWKDKRTMNAKQLTHFLEKRSLDALVICTNEIPRRPIQKPAGFVVNTDFCSGPGKHWVCFYLPKKGPAEFFDSLGHSPEYYHAIFRSFLMANGPQYLHNTKRLQDYGSPYCGAYCLDFLMQRVKGVSYYSYMTQFGDHYATNDSQVLLRLGKS